LKSNIETGDVHLLRGAPRAWLEPGKQIRASRMPTYFGELSMQVNAESTGVRATIDAPERAARLLLNLRRPIKSAKVNGADHRDCDFANGVVRLSPGTKRYTVEVRY
jgi:hypothetical protein